MKSLNVLLLGDQCLDVYIYGQVNRISPEAPVPILEKKNVESKRGMSVNVFDNLTALGCKVTGAFGENRSIKTRFIDTKTGQQLFRYDEDVVSDPINVYSIPDAEYDCIIMSDYGKGSLTYDNMKKVIELHGNIPIFIDTKKTDLGEFDRIYPPNEVFVKINNYEAEKLKTKHRHMIVTRGKEGAEYDNKIYPTPKVDVADPCGAGDTFLAALAYYYCNSQFYDYGKQDNMTDIEYAIKKANIAASITVQHMGVYAPTSGEINAFRG